MCTQVISLYFLPFLWWIFPFFLLDFSKRPSKPHKICRMPNTKRPIPSFFLCRFQLLFSFLCFLYLPNSNLLLVVCEQQDGKKKRVPWKVETETNSNATTLDLFFLVSRERKETNLHSILSLLFFTGSKTPTLLPLGKGNNHAIITSQRLPDLRFFFAVNLPIDSTTNLLDTFLWKLIPINILGRI